MFSPTDRPYAFRGFYDKVIVVKAPRAGRTVTGTFKACVFDDGFADPFSEADAETDVRAFGISVCIGDWIDAKPPQVGDRIELEIHGMNFKLAVKSVSPGIDEWRMVAREVKE